VRKIRVDSAAGNSFVPLVAAFEFRPVDTHFLSQRGAHVGRAHTGDEDLAFEPSGLVGEIVYVVGFNPEDLRSLWPTGVPEGL
jgi:hypothetical protein